MEYTPRNTDLSQCKGRRILPLFFISVLLLLIPACAPKPQLLSDPGFEPQPAREKTNSDWRPTIIPRTKDFVSFEWDKENFHSGERAVSIAIDSSHPDERIDYNWTRILPECQVGKAYELSGWVKTRNVSDAAWIAVQFWNEDRSEMLGMVRAQTEGQLSGTQDWTRVSSKFKVPGGTSAVQVRAGLSAPINPGGQVWYDDISVQEISLSELDSAFKTLEGMWSGALDAGGRALRLVLKVEQGVDGWKTTIDSVDQGALGLGVKNLTVSGEDVGFELTDIPASYSGTFIDVDHIEGFWKQGGSLPLNFERTTTEVKVNRPQEPKEPFPYTIEEVEYSFDPENIQQTLVPENKKGDSLITIGGTLTLPPGEGPHPAVLLISGSGPQDRDETIMNHKPFWVLADHLSRHGLAVLRVDDRGIGQNTGDFAKATTEDFAKDAAAGFLFLQQRKDIAGDRLALLGHSEGGLIAPMVAVEYPEVAAIVLMAGPGVDGRAVVQLQLRLMLEVQGVTAERVDDLQGQQEKLFEILCGNLTKDEFSTRMNSYVKESYEAMSAEEQGQAGSLSAYQVRLKNQLGSPWMQWFIKYDPAPTLKKLSCSVLAVNGARDLQVDPGQNLPAIKAALEAGGNEDYSIVELPQLNHLFQHCETGALSEYAQIEETLAPEFLEVITEWLQKRIGESGP